MALCSCMCTRDTALLRPEVDYARGFDSKIPPPLSAYEKERETVPFSVIGTMGLYLFPSRFYFIRYFCNYFLLGKTKDLIRLSRPKIEIFVSLRDVFSGNMFLKRCARFNGG